MMTATRTRCDHGDRDALDNPACGQPQTWICCDCGAEFVEPKDHTVRRWSSHAYTCDQRLPKYLCQCKKERGAECVDCGKDFDPAILDDYAGGVYFLLAED